MGTAQQLAQDARAIWESGVAAVRSERLVKQHVRCEPGRIVVCDQAFATDQIGRIAVVGAGKAGAGMTRAIEAACAPFWAARLMPRLAASATLNSRMPMMPATRSGSVRANSVSAWPLSLSREVFRCMGRMVPPPCHGA